MGFILGCLLWIVAIGLAIFGIVIGIAFLVPPVIYYCIRRTRRKRVVRKCPELQNILVLPEGYKLTNEDYVAMEEGVDLCTETTGEFVLTFIFCLVVLMIVCPILHKTGNAPAIYYKKDPIVTILVASYIATNIIVFIRELLCYILPGNAKYWLDGVAIAVNGLYEGKTLEFLHDKELTEKRLNDDCEFMAYGGPVLGCIISIITFVIILIFNKAYGAP